MPRTDDFSLETKELLSKRVGVKCSNPNCRKPTSGPASSATKSVNIGVAAHITAASQGGPRYDAGIPPEERRSPENGIWLCQNCGKLVDNDDVRYTVDLLRAWKRISEEAARLSVEFLVAEHNGLSDTELVRFYAQCFDRPAFQDEFRHEGSIEAFDKAIEDTITAINTGCLRSRDGTILAQSKGKAFLQNSAWREQMDTVVELLRGIRSRFALACKTKLIYVGEVRNGDTFYCINDQDLAEWMDRTREEILRIFGDVAQACGIHPPRALRRNRHW